MECSKNHVENHICSQYCNSECDVHSTHTQRERKNTSEQRLNRIDELTQFHEFHKNHCHVDYSLGADGAFLLFIFTRLPSFAPTFWTHWRSLFIYVVRTLRNRRYYCYLKKVFIFRRMWFVLFFYYFSVSVSESMWLHSHWNIHSIFCLSNSNRNKKMK